MPITKSAKKALRQNRTNRARNVKNMKTVKTTVKQYKKLVDSNKEEAKAMFPTLQKQIDKLAKTKYIKKNRASRMKSRLSRKLSTKKETSASAK